EPAVLVAHERAASQTPGPLGYIRKTPKRVSGIGAHRDASIAIDSTRRVSSGSRIPSSHRRAVAKYGLPSRSYVSRIGASNAWRSASLANSPCTVDSTRAACGPPITLIRALGHDHRKR